MLRFIDRLMTAGMINMEDARNQAATGPLVGGNKEAAGSSPTAAGGGGGAETRGGVSSGNGGANNAATNNNANSSAIPRCVCGWKNCRVYQKAFREGSYDVWDGVIKIRFIRGDAESMALKSSIDRHLRVDAQKRNEWKTLKGLDICRYTIARHHFTEKHIEKYLASNPQTYSFLKPFTMQGAKKYLFSLDNRDTLQNDNGDLFYVQVPNNSKEHVKSVFLSLKDRLGGGGGGNGGGGGGDGGGRFHKESDNATVTTNRSSSQELLAKEQENAKLKDQLEAMQSQLTFLHDMVKKLQEEHLDSRSVRSGNRSYQSSSHHRPPYGSRPGGAYGASGGAGGGGYRGSSTHSRSRRTISSRSGRSGVPKEIDLVGEEEEETASQWYENDWSEHYDEDDTTVQTFRLSYRAERRGSVSSAVSRTSRATSIVSASKSLKSLPREIELEEDEEDSDSHESLEEEAFDNRSMASNWRTSGGGGGGRGGGESGGASVVDYNEYEQDAAAKYEYEPMNSRITSKPPRGSSATSVSESNNHNRNGVGDQSVSSHNQKRTSLDGQSTDAGAGTYQVQALVVTDPYGEQGTYTGSISNATNMPHGYGRLEYDRAGRWYEGKSRGKLHIASIVLMSYALNVV